MDKFWEWMEEKRYDEDGCFCDGFNYYEPMNKENAPTKQMLIGYMIEYCFENKLRCDVNINQINYEATYYLLRGWIDRSEKWEAEEISEESSAKEMTQKDVDDIIQFGEAQSKNPKDWENHECEYDSDGGACRICKKTVIETLYSIVETKCPVCKSAEFKRTYLSKGNEARETYNICEVCGVMFADDKGK